MPLHLCCLIHVADMIREVQVYQYHSAFRHYGPQSRHHHTERYFISTNTVRWHNKKNSGVSFACTTYYTEECYNGHVDCVNAWNIGNTHTHIYIHRPQFLGQLLWRELQGKHQSRNATSRQPNAIGYWNLVCLCTTRSLKKPLSSKHKRLNLHMFIYCYDNPMA